MKNFGFRTKHFTERNDLPCFRRNLDRLVNYSLRSIMLAENIYSLPPKRALNRTVTCNSNVNENKYNKVTLQALQALLNFAFTSFIGLQRYPRIALSSDLRRYRRNPKNSLC